jgi:cation transport ATPase
MDSAPAADVVEELSDVEAATVLEHLSPEDARGMRSLPMEQPPAAALGLHGGTGHSDPLIQEIKALVMLVVALVISSPVTVVSGLAAAARRGILVKGGVHMEEGRRLRVVALDKTGTLTIGRPTVTDVVPLTDVSEDRLLQLAASLDAHSEHPVASAIVAR